MKKLFKYWSPVILWAAMIFYLSSVPGLKSDMTVFWDVFLRKLIHAGEFAVSNLLFFVGLYGGQKWNAKKAILWSFIFTVLYAVSDELHQYFVPNRECRLRDIGIDSLGALFASTVLYFVFRKK